LAQKVFKGGEKEKKTEKKKRWKIPPQKRDQKTKGRRTGDDNTSPPKKSMFGEGVRIPTPKISFFPKQNQKLNTNRGSM